MGFKAFGGEGVRLSGNAKKNNAYSSNPLTKVEGGKIPEALRLPPGKFFFGYKVKPIHSEKQEQESHYKGKGTSLREARLAKT